MRTQILLVGLLVLALVALPGCQMNERLSGTAIGGVAGIGVGALAGGFGGAVIGGAGGALVGYLVGDYICDQRERGRPNVFGDAGQTYTPPGPATQYAQAPLPQQPQADPYAHAKNEASYAYPEMVAGLKTTDAHAAYRRGRAARTAAEARRHYEHSLRLDPRQPAAHNALGLHDLIAGDRASAERRFRTALRYDPSNYAAKHNLRKMGVAGF